MYFSVGGCCSTLCHLLAQRPILIVGLGIVGLIGGSGAYETAVERDVGASQCVVTAQPSQRAVGEIQQNRRLVLLTEAGERAYKAVSNLDPQDDVLAAFLGRLPACSHFSLKEAKDDKSAHDRLKRLYFFNLVHTYGVDGAVRRWRNS